MTDDARKHAIDKTYEVQSAVDNLSGKLHLVRRTATDKAPFTEATLALADISNELMRLRMILQP